MVSRIKYSINQKQRIWQRSLRLVQTSFILLALAGMVGARFMIDQSLTSEASNQSSSVVKLENPEPISPQHTEIIQPLTVVKLDIGAELQIVIDEFVNENPDANIAISVRALGGEFSAGVKQNEEFNAASLYKTLAAYKILQMVDAGTLSLSQLTSAGHDINTCLEKAITISDNPCGIALQELADAKSTDQAALTWGYSNSTLSGYYPRTSAEDQNQLFEDIYSGKRLGDDSKQLLLGYLAGQKILNRTPEYKDAKLYLKTGDLDNTINSSALIEMPSGSYTISVLTDDWDIPYFRKYSAIEDIHVRIHEVISKR